MGFAEGNALVAVIVCAVHPLARSTNATQSRKKTGTIVSIVRFIHLWRAAHRWPFFHRRKKTTAIVQCNALFGAAPRVDEIGKGPGIALHHHRDKGLLGRHLVQHRCELLNVSILLIPQDQSVVIFIRGVVGAMTREVEK